MVTRVPRRGRGGATHHSRFPRIPGSTRRRRASSARATGMRQDPRPRLVRFPRVDSWASDDPSLDRSRPLPRSEHVAWAPNPAESGPRARLPVQGWVSDRARDAHLPGTRATGTTATLVKFPPGDPWASDRLREVPCRPPSTLTTDVVGADDGRLGRGARLTPMGWEFGTARQAGAEHEPARRAGGRMSRTGCAGRAPAGAPVHGAPGGRRHEPARHSPAGSRSSRTRSSVVTGSLTMSSPVMYVIEDVQPSRSIAPRP